MVAWTFTNRDPMEKSIGNNPACDLASAPAANRQDGYGAEAGATRPRTGHRLARSLVLTASLLLNPLQIQIAHAEIVADWGTLATPIAAETTFTFEQYDLTQSFTDQYLFSLEGGADATYSVTFDFDPCRNGCGNPDISYGIYDANGGLITDTSGTITLTSGAYVFQVKGDGMGSGNSLDYWGSVTFSLAANSMVSPAPEPSTLLLTLLGLAGLGTLATRRRKALSNRLPQPPSFTNGEC